MAKKSTGYPQGYPQATQATARVALPGQTVYTKVGVKLPDHPAMLEAIRIVSLYGGIITSGMESDRPDSIVHAAGRAIDVRIPEERILLELLVRHLRRARYHVLVVGAPDPETGRITDVQAVRGATGPHLYVAWVFS